MTLIVAVCIHISEIWHSHQNPTPISQPESRQISNHQTHTDLATIRQHHGNTIRTHSKSNPFQKSNPNPSKPSHNYGPMPLLHLHNQNPHATITHHDPNPPQPTNPKSTPTQIKTPHPHHQTTSKTTTQPRSTYTTNRHKLRSTPPS